MSVLPKAKARAVSFDDKHGGAVHRLERIALTEVHLPKPQRPELMGAKARRASDEATTCTPAQRVFEANSARARSPYVSWDKARSSTPGGSSSSRDKDIGIGSIGSFADLRKDLLQRVTQRGTVGGRRASRVDMLASDTGSWFFNFIYFGDASDLGAVETWGKYEDAVRKGSLSGFIRRGWAFGSSGYRARPDHENQLKSQINFG